MAKETQSFQAEISQLLDLMIHSLYSQKEIFLRELISNASDACDKLRYLSLTDENLKSISTDNLHIRLSADQTLGTLAISDNGIGMSREDVVQNLGTIAKSGTKEFLKKASSNQANLPELIGQFGVGFYSAFMVADRVVVHTQKAGEKMGVLWESTGNGSYVIDEVPRAAGNGTTITLHLKKPDPAQVTESESDGANESFQDFSETWTLKSLVRKYSDFIDYPIMMQVTEKTPKDPSDPKSELVEEIKDETLNSRKALWARPNSEITKEEYSEFYKHISHDWENPLKEIHYKAEGTFEFDALMFLPKRRPFNFNFSDRKWGLNLYVKRVFIMDKCEDLLPPYLRFVEGLVDSSELSLNVSREILQKDRQVSAIKKSLTNKVLRELKTLLENERSQYEVFFKEFGPVLKEGVTSDFLNKDKLVELLLFQSSAEKGLTSLKEYVDRMPATQKEIYYITGESIEKIKASPYLEQVLNKGFEVLFLVDPIDEWVSNSVPEYSEKKLRSVAKENLNLDTEQESEAKKEELKQHEENFKEVINLMKESLKGEVKDVRISQRLKESPVCLVAGEHDPSAHMERILNALGKNDPLSGSSSKKGQRILEINPEHVIFEKMRSLNADDQKMWVDVLYSQALLAEGSDLPNPVEFGKQLNSLLIKTVTH